MDDMKFRVKICDVIYMLDIQHKNTRINHVMAKYGIEDLAFIKDALKAGRWDVVR